MKMTAFNAVCPYEIGDEIGVIEVITATGKKTVWKDEVKTITDIACTHYIKNGAIKFTYELDGNGRYVPLVPLEKKPGAALEVPTIPPLPRGGKF